MKVSDLAKRGIGFVRIHPEKPEIVQFLVGKGKVLFQAHSKGLYDENGTRLELDLQPEEVEECQTTTKAD